MRSLEYDGKNGWSMADFSVMMVAVDLGPQQIDRTDHLSQHLIHRYQPSDCRRLHPPENVDDLVRKLEQIWQEIPQETMRVLYHSMPHRVAACIQAGDGSTLY
ncbi:hypothetical protein TNCV_3129641 [Trichonephila clavipes]|nr:hypothetical protein TNCV_3129641 [Trichonephila clavipes]